ncbi:MAG: DNA-directed RNA polymerase subunit alpha [Candidatus Tyloplasma litorale]|nr:MAG: DNA-directed RNA polymerase subunit alpha [Mycoplasmatales bacterium]
MDKFLKPTFTKKITEEIKQNPEHSQFIIEKLERGFGNTLGTAIRRTLLSSIPSAAPFAIKIKGAMHEFQGIDNVKEDVAEIILNLKELVLKTDVNILDIDETFEATVVSKEDQVLASDIEMPIGIEVVNKDLVIANTSKHGALNLKLFIRFSKGFRTFEENRILVAEELGENEMIIPMDSNFSPIKNVNFTVEEVNPGESYVYERLVLDVITKGNMKASEAVSMAGAILKKHYASFETLAVIDETKVEEMFEEEQFEEKEDTQLTMPIEELNLSVRSQNGLEKAKIETVGELINRPFSALKRIDNLGDKSVSEIVEAIQNLGLSFKTE